MKHRRLVFSALMAALICVTAMLFPIPLGAGYVFLSDCFVLLSAWILGARYGMAAAGLGAALADIFTPNVIYAPASLIIKAVMVLIVRCFRSPWLGAVLAELWMVLGYFLYAWVVIHRSIYAPLTSVPGNLIQGAIGLIAGLSLYRLYHSSKLSEVFHERNQKRRHSGDEGTDS